jgi:hypothetical protein
MQDSTKWTKAGIVHTWTALPAAEQLLHAWAAPFSTPGQHLDSTLQHLLHLDSSICSTSPRLAALPPSLDSTSKTAAHHLAPTGQHGQHLPPRQTAPALGQQHLQHTSTPDSTLQHSATPAAPMDSSSCTSSNSQRPAPNCPRQGQHTQQTHTRTSRFFLFLVSC